jgi:hypothetical protein
MKCILYYNNRVNEPNLSTSKERKGLVTYSKTYGIITLKKKWMHIMELMQKNLKKKLIVQ